MVKSKVQIPISTAIHNLVVTKFKKDELEPYFQLQSGPKKGW